MVASGRGRGRGRGGGGGGGSSVPKAAPIARPSYNYQWNLDHREYSADLKERREEARKADAEERQRAREQGDKVDLGAAGEYWEKIAHADASRAPAFKPSPRQAHPPRAAEAHTWQSACWSQDVAEPWAKWDGGNSAGDPWAHGVDPWGGRPSRAAPGVAALPAPAKPKTSGHVSGPIGASPRLSPRPQYGSKGQPCSGAERNFSAEEKAKRAAAREREAELRRQLREVAASEAWRGSGDQRHSCQAPEEPVSAPCGSASSTPPPHAANAPWDVASPPIGFNLAGQRLGDEGFFTYLSELGQQLDRYRAVRTDGQQLDRWQERETNGRSVLYSIPAVDLRDNRLTDASLKMLADFLRDRGIATERLLLEGNEVGGREDEQVSGFVQLVQDPLVGIPGGVLREVHLAAAETSRESFWRLCEVCARLETRCPMRVFFAKGELGHLQRVLERSTAPTYGLRIAGMDGGRAVGALGDRNDHGTGRADGEAPPALVVCAGDGAPVS